MNKFAIYPGGIKKRILYDHGLPFSQMLAPNLEDTRARIKNRKASMIIIDGAIGSGKTTLATHVADYFQGKPINLAKQIGMGGEDFQEKFQICVDNGWIVVIYDEAGDFNKRGSLTKFNGMLNRLFETYRTFQILVILVLPNFNVLDKDLIDKGIPRMLIHAERTNLSYADFKLFSLTRMFYLRERMRKLTIPMQAYGQVSPNVYGHFLDLTPERSRQLDMLSTKGKKDILSTNVIANRGWLSIDDIANKLGKNRKYVSQKINSSNIKHVALHNRRKYFEAHVLEKLRGIFVR